MSTCFCPWTLILIYAFNFVCSTYNVNVLHWLYYCDLVNEGMGLILVIQTSCPQVSSVLYRFKCLPNQFYYGPLLFLYILNNVLCTPLVRLFISSHHHHTLLHTLLSYIAITAVYLMRLYTFYYSFRVLSIFIFTSITPSSFYTDHTVLSYDIMSFSV